jgi:hypothetical protein
MHYLNDNLHTNLRVSDYVTFPKDSSKILQRLQLINTKNNINGSHFLLQRKYCHLRSVISIRFLLFFSLVNPALKAQSRIIAIA